MLDQEMFIQVQYNQNLTGNDEVKRYYKLFIILSTNRDDFEYDEIFFYRNKYNANVFYFKVVSVVIQNHPAFSDMISETSQSKKNI
ncbi:hypothetical protein TRFO_01483 [Tritrichomonas foetus]|uniref:Uncharacterized protein n=1 Tax=Tritrichomonas foetus TaxID=1144522 RepID=A0A1J4JXC2_9EUKA|nr:hypothetical protein TRFO_01483 [Tritrichomonas foetus]|eukprot:OHT03801.1 hypothetical protein TRFO_01483 [Tritrichomonas foetus]